MLEHDDLKATNTVNQPDQVTPHSGGNAVINNGTVEALLGKASWNVIRLKV
ncbi:Intracellular exo-alpha-(1-_5)-L-arabinofuranosidase [compost metagenome]